MEARHEPPFPHDCRQGLMGCQFHFPNLLRSDIPENTRPPVPVATGSTPDESPCSPQGPWPRPLRARRRLPYSVPAAYRSSPGYPTRRGESRRRAQRRFGQALQPRSEEHTSELQSHVNLVCRLLLEKKKKKYISSYSHQTKNKNNHHI